ncbi:sensor histidine kinase [Paenibacillus thalictri]|uniref:Sensor histidine kinase n=1 Tax=Paenibacillus thalictri TaxID=2527873 RepID=A0A4Q9DT96_9BACL|nr:sensor histidine kinase [Paenibacillus thalictri]TBL80118.1 sensor histidine kinase [Paenibacillus thalictri]
MSRALRPVRIKAKITAVAFFAILLSVGLSSFSIYLYVNPILSRQIVRDNQAIVLKISQQTAYLMEDVVNYAKGIVINDQVQTTLKKMKGMSGYDYYDYNLRLETILKEYSMLRDNVIIDMFVVDSRNKALEINELYGSTLYEDWYDEFRYNAGVNGFSKQHVVSNRANTSQFNVVTYVMNIYDKQNPDTYLGKLLIHLKYDVVVQPMLIDPSIGIRIVSFDKHNHLVYPDNWTEAKDFRRPANNSGSPADDVMLNEGRYYIREPIPPAHWELIGVVSTDKINASMKYINYVLFSITLICFLIMSMLIYPVVSNVTKPLVKLIRGMRQVSKGELDTRIVVKSGDEIEEVSQVFNKMVGDIKSLLEESVRMEQQKRELELKAFMYQINPHFIYNTLNCVIYLARRIDAADIAALTKAFISFLQRTIKNRPEMVSSIEEEIQYIDDYTMILKYRYDDRVEVLWEVEETCKAYAIPRMILYPLVENSIFHGILPSSQKGWIRIRITEQTGKLNVSVTDNGVGIEAQKLEKLQRDMASPSINEDLDHIGIHNVNNRLKLLFGQTAVLQIDSKEQEGTSIFFHIPRETKIS